MTPELPKTESDRVEILFTGILEGAEPKTAEIAKIRLLEMTVYRKLRPGLSEICIDYCEISLLKSQKIDINRTRIRFAGFATRTDAENYEFDIV